jgi:hypothetical protein
MIKAKTLLIFIFIIVTTATYTQAKEGLGVGIILGEPTGLTLKKWIDDRYAIDAAAAWSFSENDSFQLHADYLAHNFSFLKPVNIKKGRLPVYFGIGGRVKLKKENESKGRNDDDTLVGIRVPLGISYLFSDAPVDIFGEIVPLLDIVPDTEFDLNAAIGARFYF